MLTGIGLRNFKAFGDEMQEAPLSKITLIYGPNSGGKSSIIQAILMLKQSLSISYVDENRALMPRGELVDSGSFEALLHKHEKSREIFIRVSYRNLEQGDNSPANDVLMTFGGNGILSGVHCRIVLPQRSDRPLLDAKMRRSECGPPQNMRQWHTVLSVNGEQVVETYSSNTVYWPGRNENNQLFSNIESFLPCLTLMELQEIRENATRTKEKEIRGLEELHSQRDEEAQLLYQKVTQIEEARAKGELATPEDEAIELMEETAGKLLEVASLAKALTQHLNQQTAVYKASTRAIVENLPQLENRHLASDDSLLGESAESSLLATTLSSEETIALTPENIPYDYEGHLRSVNYLGSLRSPPKRVYEVSTQQEISEGVTGIQGEYFANALYQNSSILHQVNEWFEGDRLDINYELDVIELGDASLAGEHIAIALYPLDDAGNRVLNEEGELVAVTLADVGFGITQLLPVIIESVASHEGSIICVEQPEIHLHPRLQANIADLMIDTIDDEPGKRKQWIVETHSELLILRLQRRIREGKIKPEDISVLYVDPNDESTEGSAIKVLRLGEDSYFKAPWPDGFFADSLNEQLLPDEGDSDVDEDSNILDKLFSSE